MRVDNSHKPPADVVWSNPTLSAGSQSEYCIPSCPSCDEPTYSQSECPFCGQPFTTEDGSVPEKPCPYCTLTDREGGSGRRGEQTTRIMSIRHSVGIYSRKKQGR